MQFLVIGHDGTDDQALDRRMAARPAHLALGEKLRESGNFWYGGALRDDAGKMIGSALFMDFPSRKELDDWLKVEPYVTGKVWETVHVHLCNVREPWQFN